MSEFQAAKPRVSIITGFYNRAHVLSRTLDALLAQSETDIEIIVFDDASKDDTAVRLREYARSDNRVVPLIFEKNKGFVRGLLDAISIAKGDYIAIQGSGDASAPDRIRKQADVLDANPDVVVVGCHYDNIFEDTGLRRHRRPDAAKATFKTLQHRNVFSHGEVMFRRSAYDQTSGYRPEFRFAQDRDLWLRMIQQGSFQTVPETLYYRYILLDGVSYKPEKAVLQARYSILAGKLATLSPTETARTLEILGAEGPKALVTPKSRAFQKYILKAVLRSLIWGDTASARIFADELGGSATGAAARIVIAVLASPFGRAPMSLVRRLLGLTRDH
jgi:glycosyltransferase involved in cell wall biosynthesis